MKTVKLLLVFLTFQYTLTAQKQFWTTADEQRIPNQEKLDRPIIPQQYLTYSLDFQSIKKHLSNAPLRFPTAASSEKLLLSLPLPDGSFQQFRIEEAPTMHADLQAKYPNIRSFAGVGVEDRYATVRLEYSPDGFSAMILTVGKTYFIDPYAKDNTDFYIVYDKKDFVTDKKMSCETLDNLEDEIDEAAVARTSDGNLRNYRLALACTGEYATYHGGTVVKVMAAMNKSMTRVNGIYERENSITMTMIPNNDKLIYLNANTDPYTNTSGSTMLGQNQTTCDQQIGTANYDIGHVFSTGGGGVATLQSPCDKDKKARGVTGLSAPKNDPFDVDYVAHEMGHQFGGAHTFNNSCNNNISTGSAFEPGSGSTIMAYAGICSPNVQNNSDAYFHIQSLLQISAFATVGGGNTCPTKIDTKNNAQPSVKAGKDYIIPKSTPFELFGSATDADGDPMTYNWEQFDNQTASMPPKNTNTGGPAFRSRTATIEPIRIFPPLDNIVKNTNNTWEVLPNVARTMNFRCTARDLHNGFGRANYDAMLTTVSAVAGPFQVTAPNTNTIDWLVNSKQTVTWNVAKTDTFPVNCAKVNILLSYDGGYTYPDTLAKEIPNKGSFEVTMPNKATATARIKVKGADNIFFDISNANFKISLPPVPNFSLITGDNKAFVCSEKTDSIIYNVNVNGVGGFKENVKLSFGSLPTNVKASLSTDTITPSGVIKVIFYDLKKANIGQYNVLLKGNGTSKADSLFFNLNIFKGKPVVSQGIAPHNKKGVAAKGESLFWKRTVNTGGYIVEISKDYLFKDILETTTTSDTFFAPKNLGFKSVYFWRVKSINDCDSSIYSPTYAFQTQDRVCNTFDGSSNVVVIPSNSVFDQKLETNAVGNDKIADVSVGVKINHTFVSDLVLDIENPAGKSINLIDTKCTTFDNIDATFTDAGIALICANLPAISGDVKPQSPLTGFVGGANNGIWKLRVRDTDGSGSGGSIQSWNVKICSQDTVKTPIALTINKFQLLENTSKAITNQFLVAASPSVDVKDIAFLIVKLPTQGELRKNTVVISVGDTITQADINAGTINYICGSGVQPKDSFQFMASTINNGWTATKTFPIFILTSSSLIVTATATKTIACHNEKNAQIAIDIIGGQKPYQYSIDGGKTYQDTSYFDNLAAGKYLPTVKDAQNIVKKLDTLFVKNPPLLGLQLVQNNSNVFVKITGGTPPYLIDFNKKGFSNIDSFFQLPNGKYFFNVKDANNCSKNDSITLFVNSLVVGGVVNKFVKCFNDKNAEIVVNVKGGKTPYQYQLNGGNFQSSNVFAGLSAGKYVVTVKDAEDFLKVTDTLNIENPLAIVAKATVLQDSIYVDAFGGTGFLTYSIDGVNFSDKYTFANLKNGNYTLIVKDDRGCTLSVPIQIAVLTAFITSVKIPSCNGGKDGEITASAVNGKKPYLYSIDGQNFQTNNIFTNLGAGNYTISVKDSIGLVKTITSTLLEPKALTATAVVGTNTVLINATGGTSPYQYAYADSTTFQTSKIFENVPSGNHTFVVKDSKGCSFKVVITGVATDDLAQRLGIVTMPNPTHGEVSIAMQNTDNEQVNLAIYNHLGQLLTEKKAIFDGQKINLQHLPNGIYWFRFFDKKSTTTQRIVLAK
jgi:subtilisin-like proprotein convertase family protein